MDDPALKGETLLQYNLRMEKKYLAEPKEFTFNALHPVPERIRRGGYSNTITAGVARTQAPVDGYTWQTANWGTKWDLFELNETIETDEFGLYNFETAWGIPEGWVIRASEIFHQLRFIISYMIEDGTMGEVHYERGKLAISMSGEFGSKMSGSYVLLAHLHEYSPTKKFRKKTLQESINKELVGWEECSQCALIEATLQRKKFKEVKPDELKGAKLTGISDTTAQKYIDLLYDVFGQATIDIYNDAKKWMKAMEKEIDEIRADKRGTVKVIPIKAA
jgi:hypothetical protein